MKLSHVFGPMIHLKLNLLSAVAVCLIELSDLGCKIWGYHWMPSKRIFSIKVVPNLWSQLRELPLLTKAVVNWAVPSCRIFPLFLLSKLLQSFSELSSSPANLASRIVWSRLGRLPMAIPWPQGCCHYCKYESVAKQPYFAHATVRMMRDCRESHFSVLL